MGSESSQVQDGSGHSQPVSFGARYLRSEQFERVFKDCMELVERTAAYLDGKGRAEVRALGQPASLAYASESMRLTTRLLDCANWVLLQRAVNEGEISMEAAQAKRGRLAHRRGSGRPSHITHFAELPETLRGLIEESFAVVDQLGQLERALSEPAADGANPVGQQLDRLASVFGRG